ncbi:menaquinone biosynthetic enzyme MqnA/MqnD family protein [Desertivirga arenae]|uniref:menaquinone biosynthetic enzyme MqnA/MqnD family protein n=1 Tax=Desertivirga arenae TaxID=2810309 RepID=UPI001A96746D|nr:menaquinone biosynthesis protein [Pedobacter sp. SYSU D00823]
MNKIRVSAVSYTNTKPFIFGLNHSGIITEMDLSLDIPADCAAKLIEDKADIGLVPVAALLKIPDYHIVSDYCIGAIAAVNSVFIFSDKPIEEIQTLRLDKQSRTSNALARVLLKHYWKFNPVIVEGDADAFVEIGDRTFGKKDQYAFVYDLAEVWIKFTGLPFAFAVWASNKPIPKDFIQKFNSALAYGLEHRKEVIANLPAHPGFDLDDYLMHRIDYPLTEQKKKALDLFLELASKLEEKAPEFK